MKNLDDELKDMLRREEPPAGFAERVLRRAEEERFPRRATALKPDPTENAWSRPGLIRTGMSGGSQRTRPTRRWYELAAAAALILAIGAGAVQYRAVQQERAEQAAGEAAKEQVLQALHIASSKLQLVQAKVKGVGS